MKNKQARIRNPKRHLPADPAMLLALAWLSLILLGWPLIQIVGEHGMAALFVYIFTVWAGLVILLFTVSRRLSRTTADLAEGERL